MAEKQYLIRMLVMEKGPRGKFKRYVNIKPLEINGYLLQSIVRTSPLGLHRLLAEAGQRLAKNWVRKLSPPKAPVGKK